MTPSILLGFVLLLGAEKLAPLGVETPRTSAWPERPVAALIEQDPWAMVIGADLPLIEVFSDGTVLRADPHNSTDRGYLVSQLTPQELSSVLGSIGPTKAYLALNDFYDSSPNVTDQPTTQLILFDGSNDKSVSVYGYSLGTVATPARTVVAGAEKADAVPEEFDRVVRVLASLAPKNELPWQPRYIEVMLWPYDHSPETPMQWPADWPSPGEPLTFARGSSYSVILPGSHLSRLRTYVQQRGEKQAVAWNAGKWSIAYRLVLPGSAMAAQIATAAAKHGA